MYNYIYCILCKFYKYVWPGEHVPRALLEPWHVSFSNFVVKAPEYKSYSLTPSPTPSVVLRFYESTSEGTAPIPAYQYPWAR